MSRDVDPGVEPGTTVAGDEASERDAGAAARLDIAALRAAVVGALPGLDPGTRASIARALTLPDSRRVTELRRAIEQAAVREHSDG